MRKFGLVYLIITIILFTYSYAGNSSLSVDIVSFKNLIDDKGNYTELYYSIPYSKLKFSETENTLTATYKMSFIVREESGNEVINRTSKQGIQKAATDYKNRNKLKIKDLLKFYVQPGTYAFELELTGDGLIGDLFYEGEIMIPEYSGSELKMSQIEICSNISTDTNVEKYVKNNLMVYPNPSKVFDVTQAVIFFYAELYNLQYDKNDSTDQEYILSYYILNSKNDTVKTYPDIKNKKGGTTGVIANYINLRRYEAETYTLVLNAKDEANLQSAQQRISFALENIPYITEEYANNFRNMIDYIANESELNIFAQLNLIGKQTFIEQFWKKRDPSPETQENEFKQVYLQRWNYVNNRYVNESLTEEGWQTDRGRIYLLHGSPTEVERYTGDPNMKDHEVWLYERGQSGTKKFIFADLYMRGKFFLIHSKSPRQTEVYNPNWKNSVKIR
jgi:GWxTD domain-containing protein